MKKSMQGLWEILTFSSKQNRLYILSLIVMAGIGGLYGIGSTLMLRQTISAATDKDLNLYYTAIVIYFALLLLIVVIKPIAQYMFQREVLNKTCEVRAKVMQHLLSLSMDIAVQVDSGDTLSRVTNDINEMENAYSIHIKIIIGCLLNGLASGCVILLLNWKLAGVLIGIGLVATLINGRLSGWFRKISDLLQEQTARVIACMNTVLNGMIDIKLYTMEKKICEVFDQENKSLFRIMIRMGVVEGLVEGMNYLLYYINFISVLSLGALMALSGSISVGSMIAITNLLNGVNGMFSTFANQLIGLQASLASANRVFELFEMPVEQPRVSKERIEKVSEIELKDIGFCYGTKQVLKDVNMQFFSGSVNKLLGESGSGKSTVSKLISGLYQADAGEIMIDNKSILEIGVYALRDMVSYLPQDPYIFSTTVKENIGFGKEGASMDEIEEAAKKANAHAFITRLPQGYSTVVDNNSLSGGQIQRIALARALLKDAPVYVLDEATSALDTFNEEDINRVIEEISVGHLVLLVTHKLSSVKNTDRLFWFEQGIVCHEEPGGKSRQEPTDIE